MKDQPWTWNEFNAAMKAAGWQRMSKSDPAKTYIHSEHGTKFYPLTYRNRREVWRMFADRHEVPGGEEAPF